MDRAFLNATLKNQIPDKEKSSIHQSEDINIPAVSEKYRKTQLDWILSDDDDVVSFSVGHDLRSISYKTFNGKERVDKSWDFSRGKIVEAKSVDEPGANIAAMVDSYGIPATQRIFESYFRYTNYQFSQQDRQKELDELARGILSGARIIESGNEKYIYANIVGGNIEVIDRETGDAKTINIETDTSYPPRAMLALADNQSFAASFGKDIKIFDSNTADCIKNFNGHEFEISCLRESKDGRHIISGSYDASIKMWDKITGECIKTFKCAGLVESAFELSDGQHLVYYCSTDGKTRILNKQTGQVIKIIEGGSPREDPRGGISVLHDNKIKFWRFGGARGAEPANISVRGKNVLSDYERFGNFSEERFEIKNEDINTGIFWLQYSNLEAKRLGEKKKFKWGKERLYFNVPLDRLKQIGNLIKELAKNNKIAVSLKYLDTESSKGIDGEATRFVANFSSIEDAKRFYDALSTNKDYKNIEPDQEADYLAYNIDGKAHYASGYREIREQQMSDHMKYLDQIIKNKNGTYTLVSLEGSQKILSKDEYEKELGKYDFSQEFKKKWEG